MKKPSLGQSVSTHFVTDCGYMFLFFFQVYHRLKSRPSLAEKLDKYLENFNKSEQIYLGKFKLSVEVLGKSKTLLRQFLLQNPHLSDSQYKLTLKLYGMTIGETQTCSNNEELSRDFCNLSQTRAALYLLCKMRDRLTEDIRMSQEKTVKTSLESSTSNVREFPSAVSSAEVAVDVTSQCLFKYVQHQLKFGGKISSGGMGGCVCLLHTSRSFLIVPDLRRASCRTESRP